MPAKLNKTSVRSLTKKYKSQSKTNKLNQTNNSGKKSKRLSKSSSRSPLRNVKPIHNPTITNNPTQNLINFLLTISNMRTPLSERTINRPAPFNYSHLPKLDSINGAHRNVLVIRH